MYSAIAFHFVLLAAGEVLKYNTFVNPQKLQDYITEDESFGGIRVPLDECRLALVLLENSGFLKKIGKEDYKKPIEISPIKKEKNDYSNIETSLQNN